LIPSNRFRLPTSAEAGEAAVMTGGGIFIVPAPTANEVNSMVCAGEFDDAFTEPIKGANQFFMDIELVRPPA
jgi:hypothetical protein